MNDANLRLTQHLNFLSPLAFRLQIEKVRMFNHCVTSVILPWIQIGHTIQHNPFSDIPVPGDHMKFGTMDVGFNVDEEMISWRELIEWSIEIGKPDALEQRKPMMQVRSDGELTILTSSKNPFLSVKFYDMILTDIGQMQFDTKTEDNNPVTCSASFAFRKYEPVLL
jgi:hypothetical protein